LILCATTRKYIEVTLYDQACHTTESVLLPRWYWCAWLWMANSASLPLVATPTRSVSLGKTNHYVIAFQDALAVSAMNEDTPRRRDRTPVLIGLAIVSMMELSGAALDEYDKKLSFSVANTFAKFSGCVWPCPPRGGCCPVLLCHVDPAFCIDGFWHQCCKIITL
jgi:hypothetical protein